MKTMSKIVSGMLIAAVSLFFVTGAHAQAKPWQVPAADKAAKSTVKLTDPSVIATGKELYAKHCKSCHGTTGLGDGVKSATLKTTIISFSDAAFKSQTDGEIFFKTSKGRDEMPAYDKKIPEASDRWALVAYMRTLSK